LHPDPEPGFGGVRPDPSGPAISLLSETVKGKNAFIMGLATDPDADRFGIVDRDGTVYQPNEVLSLLLDYLAETRGWKSGAKICRSVATTSLLDLVAAHHGLSVIETPVGFKYVGELLSKGEIVFGGEESGGLTMEGHLPEKDGILACLLVAEMVASRGISLGEQLQALYKKVGTLYSQRYDADVPVSEIPKLKERLSGISGSLFGRRIDRVVTMDGFKFIFDDGSWLLLRPSGTEPVVRVYSEARTQEAVSGLISAAQKELL